MVSKNDIDWVFTKTLSLKCTYTLKGIRSQITQLITDITDNEEEYDILMDAIPRFIRDNHNKSVEVLVMRDYDGNTYESVGDYYTVDVLEEAVEKGMSEGLFFSGHNHPNGTCFQSIGDFKCIRVYNQKYSWTWGVDGLMIVKNSNPAEIGIKEEFLYNSYYGYEWSYRDRVNEYSNGEFYEVTDLINSLDENDNKGVEECLNKLDAITNEWYGKHIVEEIDLLNSNFNKGNRTVDNINAYYLPISKN